MAFTSKYNNKSALTASHCFFIQRILHSLLQPCRALYHSGASLVHRDKSPSCVKTWISGGEENMVKIECCLKEFSLFFVVHELGSSTVMKARIRASTYLPFITQLKKIQVMQFQHLSLSVVPVMQLNGAV